MAEIIGEVGENVCSSFQWSIPDFFSLSANMGDYYQSPDFECGDATWCLLMYPNGEDSAGYVTVFLKKQISECSNHVVSYILGIKDKNGEKNIYTLLEHEFIGNEECWGEYILPRTELLEDKNSLAPENIVTVFCTLSIDHIIVKATEPKNTGKCIGEDTKEKERPEEEDSKDNQIKDFRNPGGVDKFFEDFGGLFLSKECSDVIFKTKEREFPAHKLILGARSPVFRSMFSHDVVETNTGVVEIPDCDPGVFEAFLFYLYSIKMKKEMSASTAIGLFTVADKYDVPDLKAVCVEIMIKEISIEAFCDIVTVALLHNESKLVEICTEYFTKNMKGIIETVQWQLFIKENPISANELYIKALNCYTLIAE